MRWFSFLVAFFLVYPLISIQSSMGKDKSRQSRALRPLEPYNKSPNGTSRGHSKDHGTGDDRTTHESPCSATSSCRKSHGPRSRSRSQTQLPEWAKQLLQQQSNAAELKRLQNELANAMVPKVAKKQRTAEPKFRFARNKKQYELNRDVAEKIDEALEIADAEDQSSKLKEGRDLLLERNKHICWPKSTAGILWRVTLQSLLPDSDDEKGIRKAVKESKQLREEKKRSSTAKPKPKGGVPRQFPERGEFSSTDQSSLLLWRENCLRVMCAQRVFAAFSQAILPRIAEQPSPPIGHREPGNPIQNNPPSDSFFNFCQDDPGKDHGSAIVDCDYIDLIDQNSIMRVKGRLCENIAFWQNIGASRWLLKVLCEGYCLPFVELPVSKFFRNHNSASCHPDFVSLEISKLLVSGALLEVISNNVRVCNPLGVAANSSGKPRLILDLRYVNQHLRSCKFKYEDIRTAADLFQKCDWFLKFDYTSGYHHLEIFPEHTPFLGCSWVVDGQRRFYQFTVLPFGLSTGPYIFTKVQRALTKYWRSQGIRIFTYLDDGAGADNTFFEAQEVSDLVRRELHHSGFVTNDSKSIWTPVQSGEWLGFILDLSTGTFQVPPRRI